MTWHTERIPKAATMSRRTERVRGDWVGVLIGLLTFLAGIGLLVLTFQQAYVLFTVPPEVAMGTQGLKTVDLARAGESLAIILVRILLLLVMSIVGSIVATRGIRLYVLSRTPTPILEETRGRREPVSDPDEDEIPAPLKGKG